MPTPPATAGDGSLASTAGMAAPVPGSTPANTIDTELTKSRDYTAWYAARNTANLLDLWVGPTAPAHAAGRIWIKTS